jgi:hypothetical protein
MADLYLDPVNGNDGNAGTSFALRKKTMTSFSAVALAAADRVKLIKSADPVSLGNATWTANSNTVTLATAKTLNIDLCETAWTANTNVTTTTSTNRRQGSNSASIAPAGAFTTGRLAHKATGTLNLSSYSQVCFWINSSITLTAGQLELRLCSDTGGVTAVHTLALPAIPAANVWQMVLLDNAGAMNSAIASAALYASADFGAATILIDNVLACNKATLHLGSVIGKNTAGECFWGIESINDTSIILARSAADTTPAQGRGYKGTTETVTTYSRECLRQPVASTNTQTIHQMNDSGAMADPPSYIIVSGGWNDTDMSTQTGETWIDGQNGFGRCFSNGGNQSFIYWEKLGCVRFYQAFFHQGSTTSQFGKLVECRAVMSANDAFLIGGPQVDLIDCYSVGTGSAAGYSLSGPSGNNTFTRCKAFQSGAPGFYLAAPHCTLIDCESYNNGNYGYQILYGPSRGINCSCGNNGTAGIQADGGADWVFIDLLNENATEVGFVYNNTKAMIRSQNHDRTAGYHRGWMYGFNWESDTSLTQPGSGTSIKISVTSTDRNSINPAKVLLGVIGVKANETTTISAYLRRSAAGIEGKLVVPGGQIAGVPNNVEAAAVGSGAWEQVSLNITPTENGAVEVWCYCYGGSTHTVNVDTMGAVSV